MEFCMSPSMLSSHSASGVPQRTKEQNPHLLRGSHCDDLDGHNLLCVAEHALVDLPIGSLSNNGADLEMLCWVRQRLQNLLCCWLWCLRHGSRQRAASAKRVSLSRLTSSQSQRSGLQCGAATQRANKNSKKKNHKRIQPLKLDKIEAGKKREDQCVGPTMHGPHIRAASL
jgi:hypothetical protein